MPAGPGRPATAGAALTEITAQARALVAMLDGRLADDRCAGRYERRDTLFEQAFKNIDDVLRKDAGSSSELDYTEQTSWLLFLKYLDALEQDKATEAALHGRVYEFIIAEPYRWTRWAAPKGYDGKIDYNHALTGDDLREFVDGQLFPYLRGFKERAAGPNTIEYKIGEIFGEIKNRFQSGYNLREVIDIIDTLRFGSQAEKHELSYLYEAKIRNMGNAGRNGGEYYTPRPLIRAMVKVIDPKIGETHLRRCGGVGRLPVRGVRVPERQAGPDDDATSRRSRRARSTVGRRRASPTSSGS